MVNLTPNTIVFNVHGAALNRAIRDALSLAADTSLSIHGLTGIDMRAVTTKSNIRGGFAKFVRGRVLARGRRAFGEEYVVTALDAYKQKTGYLTQDHFNALMYPDDEGEYGFKSSYASAIRPGVGLFLVALHSSGAITLPATFSWPSVRNDASMESFLKRREVGSLVASELLKFIRGLDTQSETQSHEAFKAIGGDRKRREWFLTYATKLLLATGWHKAEDVNVGDLLAIKAAEETLSPGETLPLAYKPLLDVLRLAFGERVQVTSEDWALALRGRVGTRAGGRRAIGGKALQHLFKDGPRSDHDLVDELLHVEPGWGKPAHIQSLARLPGLEVDLSSLSRLWLELEELYIKKTRRESYKGIKSAFSWWNIYLFYYLPYWFSRNSRTALKFPSSPSLLLKTAFVSRLLPTSDERPVTFVEFMNAQSEKREWNNNSYYSTLHQLQSFFAFIERYGDEMPGCEGFTQPLSPHDFPRTSRPKATKKQPVPRGFFGVYLDYHEALLAHLNVVMRRVLDGDLDTQKIQLLVKNENVIDTFATSEMVGFVPVLFTPTKTLPLQFIPNVLDIGVRTLHDGRKVSLPHPHGLHQNLTALHTGIRHNHIQWLDIEKFDSEVDESQVEFAELFVNTDKTKREAWTPHVSMRVIELLRAQRRWSQLIYEPRSITEHYYNDNPDTKWPKLRPLFSYTAQGQPHSDNVYTNIWGLMLCGLQGLMPDFREYGLGRQLLRLLPPRHRPNDPELRKKLFELGSQYGMGEACPLKPMTSTTPHSARVAVVSQYITFLPTDLIGKYITGQKEGVVPYYVHLDQETLEAERVHQAARMRAATLRSAFEPVLSGREASTTFVHADAVNSNLARSMRANFDEAIVSYGGMSISFTERSKSGVDILRKTNCVDAAFNKTEVCPYGNQCPPEIVMELKGLRRCSLCPAAVRTIDHLPAVVAKKRQVAEMVDELDSVLAMDAKTLNAKYTSEELDDLEADRARLCEELSGWILNEEVLEVARQRIAAGKDTRKWVVQKPEIIERDLRRVATPTSVTEYLLARLGECISFPTLESPQIRARFDLLRRELLARAGQLRAAFAPDVCVDPAAECAGMLKTLLAATGLTVNELAEMLEQDAHMLDLPETNLRLISASESE
ncbi:MAG: hypothetical protein JSS56_08855 [Proteobacteria bacterium]|nr:hypothetical protein [Pseudomonadota bacterium]